MVKQGANLNSAGVFRTEINVSLAAISEFKETKI